MTIQREGTRPRSVSNDGSDESGHGYDPQYHLMPFTDFESVNPDTPLESLNLNWREQDLPERVRTKHVHRLHPYLGKFVPQLVEVFLRKFRPEAVCDPFGGSGTTLVEAAALGIDAVGCDISEFNCLISRVKTSQYELSKLRSELENILDRTIASSQNRLFDEGSPFDANEYLGAWLAPPALNSLLTYRSLIGDYNYGDVMKLVLSRAARSARRTTHFDLDFPKKPQIEPYHCYKHSRTCRPTEDAEQFLKRYTRDTFTRIRDFAEIRQDVSVSIISGDSAKVRFPQHDLVVTSPPYVGLIDYHEQHRYAYELLGLPWRAEEEIGRASKGNSQRARSEYVENMVAVFKNVKKSLAQDGRIVVIVNDKHGLYHEVRESIGMVQEARLERHVNRRTGRRSSDFYESVLVWQRA